MRVSCGLLLLACLLSLPVSSAVGKGQSASDVLPFDRYGRINWDEEKKHLDAFAKELKQQPHTIGYIYIQEAQISGAGYAVGHAIDLAKYLIEVHDIPWNRVAWRDLGFGDSFETTLWLFPAGRPPLNAPKYQPATDLTFVEGAPRPGLKKHRRGHRAANMRLHRTRW